MLNECSFVISSMMCPPPIHPMSFAVTGATLNLHNSQGFSFDCLPYTSVCVYVWMHIHTHTSIFQCVCDHAGRVPLLQIAIKVCENFRTFLLVVVSSSLPSSIQFLFVFIFVCHEPTVWPTLTHNAKFT